MTWNGAGRRAVTMACSCGGSCGTSASPARPASCASGRPSAVVISPEDPPRLAVRRYRYRRAGRRHGWSWPTRPSSTDALDPWTAAARCSELRGFADSIARDHAAVAAALRLPWSTGPVEGRINKLKLVKRQMYGRANFDLLRQRVLAAA